MKLKELNAMVEKMIKESLFGGEHGPTLGSKQWQLYRKSQFHPDQLAKKQVTQRTRKTIDPGGRFDDALTQVLVDIDGYPAVQVITVDPKTRRTITVPNNRQRQIAIIAASRILHGQAVSKSDVNNLGRFIVGVGALPAVPFAVIIRGLAAMFVRNSQ